MISLPQTKVTTFAFASVFILLLCSQQFCTFIEHNIQPKSGTIAVYEPEITNYSRYQTSYILFFTNWEHLHRSIDRSTTRTCNFSLSYSTIFKFWLWIETVKKEINCSGDSEILHEIAHDTARKFKAHELIRVVCMNFFV